MSLIIGQTLSNPFGMWNDTATPQNIAFPTAKESRRPGVNIHREDGQLLIRTSRKETAAALSTLPMNADDKATFYRAQFAAICLIIFSISLIGGKNPSPQLYKR